MDLKPKVIPFGSKSVGKLHYTGCSLNTLPKKYSYNFQTFIHKIKNRGSFGNRDIGILHEQAIF